MGFYLSVGGHDSDPLLQIYLVTCLSPHTVTSSEKIVLERVKSESKMQVSYRTTEYDH